MLKADLEQIWELHIIIKNLTNRREQLRDAAMRITTHYSHEPKNGGQQDKMAQYAARLDALDQLYTGKLLELEAKRRLIELDIDEFPQQQRIILRLRYLEGLPWAQVAKQSHYSKDHCYTIHRAALRKMA